MLNSSAAWRPSPYLLLVLTTLFWSGNFVLGRAVHAVFAPFTLSFWRWSVALVVLLPFVWSSLRAQRPLLRRHWPILFLLSVLGVVNFNTFVYLGLQSTTATNAVIMLSVTPVLIVGLSFLLLRQTVTGWQALGIGVPLDAFSRLNLTYGLEEIKIHNVDTNASEFFQSQKGDFLKSSLTLEVVRDSRDSSFIPTRGMRSSSSRHSIRSS